jgi:3-oxoacyl-[acyl-carrier protein] reductase
VTINNLLPGSHDTDRIKALDGDDPSVRAAAMARIPARRYGTTAEFGAMCAFLCSVHAGFIVGQNILLDGGVGNTTL